MRIGGDLRRWRAREWMFAMVVGVGMILEGMVGGGPPGYVICN